MSQSTNKIADTSCPPRDSLLYSMLTHEEANKLDAISNKVIFDQEECLFRQHSEASYFYNVISGTLLVERLSVEGQRQVLNFLFPGEFLGFTHNPFFEFSLYSLTDAEISVFKRKRFNALCTEIPQLKSNVEQIGSNVLAGALDQIFALGQKKAHERVCFFLKQVLKRQSGTSENQLTLVMSRRDIGNYLGLTIETVSRAFTKLKNDRIINIHDAIEITIIDRQQLDTFASAE